MLCFYLTLKQGDFNRIPELQVCIAEVLYDVGSYILARDRDIYRIRAK